MAKRHVIVLSKTDGDEAVLNASTLRQLDRKDGGEIAIKGGTNFYVLTAIPGDVGPDQITVPSKASLVKEGDRLTIEAASGTAHAVTHHTPPGLAGQQEPFDWDPIGDAGFDEIVGMTSLKARIEQALFYLSHPEWFLIRKSLPPRVFLLFGPYGSGKTMFAKAMASHLAHADGGGIGIDVKMKIIKATGVKDPYLGMSARHVQQYLDAAREQCNQGDTVLLILDEIDSLVPTRTGGQTHEEYRDIVNTFLQEIQGTQELDAETRIRKLLRDKKVQGLRGQLAAMVRDNGVRDQLGNIMLPEGDWTDDVREKMLLLRGMLTEAGGVSTVIIVGTTNDPCRIDEGFISRAGDNTFFVPRPPAEAIEQMLAAQLDSAFVELSDPERRTLAEEAFQRHLTGRDIMLSWLGPLRTMDPGSLTITGYKTIHEHMPSPNVDVEWELDLLGRLRERGHSFQAKQVEDYLRSLPAAEQHEARSQPQRPKQPGEEVTPHQPPLFDAGAGRVRPAQSTRTK